MSIELYVFPPSPRAFKVMAVANHLGLDCQIRFLDMRQGAHKASDYAAMNPNMRMPTMKDGDWVLWESEAIIQYLALQKPEANLLPKDDRARLDVTRWQFWNLAHWDPNCAVFIFENFVKRHLMGIMEPDRAALEKVQEPFERNARVLDGHLKGRSFIAGNALSLADFSIGAALNIAGPAGIPLAPYAEIRRWFAALNALPAWQRTLAEAAAPAAAA
ncbi:MAG TPA: glutathione S-transferase family protein [Steroidobacteraceae bacterium]|nr:glutathione S-transferase family protein [Steroidobacteraceae bacterium]